MSVNTKNEMGKESLAIVREEHAAWYGAMMRFALYPDDQAQVGAPTSFLQWLKNQAGIVLLRGNTVQRLRKIHDDLHEAGMQFLARPRDTSSEVFDRLTLLFEEFLIHLTRLEHDMVLENSGLDAATGLRSQSVLIKDLDRELDRMARQGKPFALAVARIDDFEQISKSLTPEQVQGYTRQFAGLLQKSVRSFDDAYAAQPGEYILCFKQSSVQGGFRALERLRVLLNEENIELPIGDKTMPLSASCCVGEPLPGDNMNDFINELRRDMRDSVREPGTVLKYHELAPVKRFIKTTAE